MANNDKSQTVIAAVSGGVDSVVMLNELVQTGQKPVVVHFDHGIRQDSSADARFVETLVEKYGLKFELGKGRLSASASEDAARSVRHAFLRKVSRKYGDAKIATAHHRGDVIETATINILRGTGRRGMSSLRETNIYSRPLINWTKQKIYDYAAEHRLEWVEDATNRSDKYLRNRVRHRLVPLMKQAGSFSRFEELVDWFYENNPIIDEVVAGRLSDAIEETKDHTALELRAIKDEVVGKEMLLAILNKLKVEIDQTEISRLFEFATSGREGAVFNQFPPVRIIKQTGWLLFQKPDASRD